MGQPSWCILGLIGFTVILLFAWFAFWKKQEFNVPLLGLLTLGLMFIGIAIIKPDYIKYGDMELGRLTREAKEATVLAYETSALLIWNQGKLGGGLKNQEDVATRLLEQAHGKNALQFRHYLQHKGIFLTPSDQLKKVPHTPIPKGLESPLYDRYLKEFAEQK